MSQEFVTVLPSAGRLMTSLRDIGYDVASAVADLVDNAIDANATRVEIDLVADGPDSWLRVADNGLGMSAHRLDEAMRYGSDSDYQPRSLGHFGLGLKTASLSQCRRLTVASRGTRGGQVAVRRWDLDIVLRRDSWDLERLTARDTDPRLISPLGEQETGTVVLWERMDRVLPRKPTSGLTARVLGRVEDELRSHLAMVFHRFLDGEAYAHRRSLELLVNGVKVSPWDPYARYEPHTRALPSQRIAYQDADGTEVAIDVQPYVLPAQHLFSSPESHRIAGGPHRWNRHQGLYIYRRERLIQAGGWNRLRTLDEHAKLARIAIDLPVGQEERFAVDVAKMRVSIPEDLRPELRTLVAATVAIAQERYREHDDASDRSEVATPGPEAISISRDWPAIMAAVDEVLGDDVELRDRLLIRLANADPADVATLRG